jgi:hypothetical protein
VKAFAEVYAALDETTKTGEAHVGRGELGE